MAQGPKNHYQVLGVAQNASAAEVRSAFRRLALKFHPDHNDSPAATEMFIRITDAYEVLGNAARRRDYDRTLLMQAQTNAQSTAATKTSKYAASHSAKTADRITLQSQVEYLQNLFSKRRFGEAEVLANVILTKDPRVAVAYDVLGEIVRSRGDLKRAAKFYALALQMEPSNANYLRKHEEMLRMTAADPKKRGVQSAPPESSSALAPFVGFVVVVAAACYVALAKEKPFVPDVALFSTWTLGLFLMLMISGVAAGAGMSSAGWLDKIASHGGKGVRLPAGVALLFVAVANFWLATLLYLQSGAARKSFDYSAGRLVGAVGAITAIFALSAQLSGGIDPVQVLIWGGNAVYVGAIAGWLAADLLRE